MSAHSGNPFADNDLVGPAVDAHAKWVGLLLLEDLGHLVEA
jgi:hypothetical protein